MAPAVSSVYLTIALHDALPISRGRSVWTSSRLPPLGPGPADGRPRGRKPSRRRYHLAGVVAPGTCKPNGRTGSEDPRAGSDRKSTRLNSSHVAISYAVLRMKKK